jgi:hypothetical protein
VVTALLANSIANCNQSLSMRQNNVKIVILGMRRRVNMSMYEVFGMNDGLSASINHGH